MFKKCLLVTIIYNYYNGQSHSLLTNHNCLPLTIANKNIYKCNRQIHILAEYDKGTYVHDLHSEKESIIEHTKQEKWNNHNVGTFSRTLVFIFIRTFS